MDLYCEVGLQVALVLPSWTLNWTCTAYLGSNLASKCLSRAPQPLRITFPCTRERKFSKLPFVLPKCFWTAFWHLLEPSWAPFELNLGPLGHLLGSTWGLWAAFGAHLGPSWAPLGLHLALLGASWANLGPSGRQMGSKWTPSGRKMGAKWASFGRQVDAKLDCRGKLPLSEPQMDSKWTPGRAANVTYS